MNQYHPFAVVNVKTEATVCVKGVDVTINDVALCDFR